MSIVDRAIAAVTPPESNQDRVEATQKARSESNGDDWLAIALDHHDAIRTALKAALSAAPDQRTLLMKRLAVVLNGHALAEEIVLYPALAKAHEKSHANMAYTEQTATKMQMAELERLDPASEDWVDKLKHIEGALLHHMYEEEGHWFLEIKRQYRDQATLKQRFLEEYQRYVGADG
ncbi:hemerythrin domain-containing protein [Terricaulis sp.]|uniref:hemerythrin domain-containing protein n=1 Tax=Terricaulis sp. TaxID=2768686 RepID=UPI002AC6762E|nr:hemerythrin domain-containing protein [Terricaulis sp.]MDZ4690296.1 hemerythrin domain-containing protein [Terricaulis sp.]